MTPKALLRTSRALKSAAWIVFAPLFIFLAFYEHAAWPILAATVALYLALLFFADSLQKKAIDRGALGSPSYVEFTLDANWNAASSARRGAGQG